MPVAGVEQVASEEAIVFCERLGVAVDATGRQKISGIAAEEFGTSSMAARAAVADRASTLVRAVQRAVESGEIPPTWGRDDKMQELITTGLGKHDPRVAFQATLRSAYNAGRYQRGMEDLEDEEYFIYRTMRDSRVRSSHAILNGVYLPKDHPFWKDHYPQNGSRCRCLANSASERDIRKLKKAGVPLQDVPPEEELIEYKDKLTGRTFKLPASIEPGWDYNPGTDEGIQRMAEQLQRRMQALADLA
jgi:hypothetical protein